MLEGGEVGEDAFAQVPLEELKALRPAYTNILVKSINREEPLFLLEKY